MQKLNQVLAIEKQVKASAGTQLTKIYQQLQKEPLLQGISRMYQPLNDEGERFPPERQMVQLRTSAALQDIATALSPLFDATATRDNANCSAKASVKVEGKEVLPPLPAVTLLYLQKQLQDIHTAILALPELQPTETWKFDPNQDCYVTEPVQTAKSKKVPRAFVKAEATPQHPAQVDTLQEDILQGYWTTIKYSGAMPVEEKRKLRARCEQLMAAVKFAREEANQADAPQVTVSKQVFQFLLG